MAKITKTEIKEELKLKLKLSVWSDLCLKNSAFECWILNQANDPFDAWIYSLKEMM